MRIQSAPVPELSKLVSSRNFWLLMALSVLLLFISPALAGTVVLLGLVGLMMEVKARNCILNIDGDILEFRNSFIIATMSRGMFRQSTLRGNSLFGHELLIKGDCSVAMKNGKTHFRQSILIPDAFEIPLRDVQKTIEGWANGGSQPTEKI